MGGPPSNTALSSVPANPASCGAASAPMMSSAAR